MINPPTLFLPIPDKESVVPGRFLPVITNKKVLIKTRSLGSDYPSVFCWIRDVQTV